MSIPNSLPKIAIFIPSSAIGGAEHYVKNIFHLILNLGFQPTLVLPQNTQIIEFFSRLPGNSIVSNIAWSGDAEDLNIGDNYLNKLSRQYKEAINTLESIKPDCAFINLPWVDFGLGISLACHDLKIPTINLVHLCPWKVDLNNLTKQIFQNLASANSNFYTVSNDNRIQLSLSTGIDLDLIKVFYNSRDVESEYLALSSRQYKIHRLELLDELELPLNSFLSISVGRFSHQKNFLDIITTYSDLHSRLPNYYHLFLGEGELKDYYQQIVEDLNLGNRIKFLGYRKDVARFLALSDLFISSSLYEGLALSILEAAQFSCPIIAANSSSAKEIIPSAEYGFLYNPGQYYLLGKYIEFAYFNPQEMKQKALKLKSFCQEKFSLTKFNHDLQTILESTLNSPATTESNSIPLFYDRESQKLKIDQSMAIANDSYQSLPKLLTKATKKFYLPLQEYSKQLLEKKHFKFLHSLHKLSKNFVNQKIILCFGSFNTNFFRNYYLKEKFLLLVISQANPNCCTLNLHSIDHTYWGQDIEPDCLAKYTTFEQVTDIAELEQINSSNTDSNHYYTSKNLLNSYFQLSNSEYLNNLSINLKIIDKFFQPSQYYLLDKDPISQKIKMRLARQ